MKIVRKMSYLIEKKEYATATKLAILMFNILNDEAGMEINFNNINQPSPYKDLDELKIKVNKYVKPILLGVNQTLEWNYISNEVFQSLNESFLVPSTKYCKFLFGRPLHFFLFHAYTYLNLLFLFLQRKFLTLKHY